MLGFCSTSSLQMIFFGFVQRKSPFYFWDSQQFWDHFVLGFRHLGDWKEPLRHGDRIQLGWVWRSQRRKKSEEKCSKHLEGGDYKEIWYLGEIGEIFSTSRGKSTLFAGSKRPFYRGCNSSYIVFFRGESG